MVSKLHLLPLFRAFCFRAVLFRMVSKQRNGSVIVKGSFRAVLFRMVSKPLGRMHSKIERFRAVLFRMVSKPFTIN